MRTSRDKPNIVLINCDDLGYGDLSCYGSPVNSSPMLDRLAERGIRFTDFYMASGLCSPSRGAMLTGCYPRRIGFGSFEGRWVLFPGQGVGLNPNEITIAALLRNAGYATMHIGKWHCGDQPPFLPTRHGFEHYFGIPFSNDMGRQAGASAYEWPPLPLMEDEEVIQAQPDQAALTERYVEHALCFIRKNRDHPFFLYLAHMYVHLPIYVSTHFLARSKNGAYGGAVACVDWAAGVLSYELGRLGIAENTLIVFTSDNGSRGDHGGSNAPLRGRKGTTWEGGQRVPCIMYWPGVIPPGSVSNEPVSAMDFLPTFCSISGASTPDDRIIDGSDIFGILSGETGTKVRRKPFFFYARNELEAVRSGPWKLHVRKRSQKVRELYNLEEDICEQHNVYREESETVRELQGYLDRCREDLGDEAVHAAGANCRPIGRVDNPKPLTRYDQDYPYVIAEYDLEDRG